MNKMSHWDSFLTPRNHQKHHLKAPKTLKKGDLGVASYPIHIFSWGCSWVFERCSWVLGVWKCSQVVFWVLKRCSCCRRPASVSSSSSGFQTPKNLKNPSKPPKPPFSTPPKPSFCYQKKAHK